MPKNTENPGAFTPRRIRRGIKLDRVQAADFNQYELIFACEQCSFFSPEGQQCLMGMPTKDHLREQQLKTFNLTGHMAFCRFLEID